MMEKFMLIGHFSDLHGDLNILRNAMQIPDLWICSGDFFPNKTRGNIPVETKYQTLWFQKHKNEILDLLGGIPVLCVGGNHDYVSFASLLRNVGHEAYEIPRDGIDFMGHRFAGFREINFIQGEWNGETPVSDMKAIVDQVLDADPDILVTHAPPSGIFDRGNDYGISALILSLMYRDHKVKYHFFGHSHLSGGQIHQEMGIIFINSACHVQFIEV